MNDCTEISFLDDEKTCRRDELFGRHWMYEHAKLEFHLEERLTACVSVRTRFDGHHMLHARSLVKVCSPTASTQRLQRSFKLAKFSVRLNKSNAHRPICLKPTLDWKNSRRITALMSCMLWMPRQQTFAQQTVNHIRSNDDRLQWSFDVTTYIALLDERVHIYRLDGEMKFLATRENNKYTMQCIIASWWD